MNDLTVVIPVYKEDLTVVTKLYKRLKSTGADVIVVEDGATMNLEFSEKYYPHRGYGYAIKYGISKAKTPLVLTMDGDGQHRIEDAMNLYWSYKKLNDSSIDIKMVVGVRTHLSETLFRRFGRKFLNFIATIICNHYLVDLNSGIRIFDKSIAIAYQSILCDTFSFTTSLTVSMITDNYKVAWFPIKVLNRENGSSKVRVVHDGFVTLYYILRNGLALRTRGIRKWKRDLLGRLTSRVIGAVAQTVV